MTKSSKITERSFQFAIDIIQLYKILIDNSEFILAKQLLRSGTSIGANVKEAVAASSRRDFLNKMNIASKEAYETEYWLELLIESKLVRIDLIEYLNECKEICKMLTAIVKSTKESLSK